MQSSTFNSLNIGLLRMRSYLCVADEVEGVPIAVLNLKISHPQSVFGSDGVPNQNMVKFFLNLVPYFVERYIYEIYGIIVKG